MEKLQPKLRFPEFKGDLEYKKIEDFTVWASGGTPSKQNENYWNGNIPWISASSMRGLVYSDSDLKITEEGLKKGSKIAKKGTLLLLVRGSMLFNKIPIGIAGVDVAFNQDLKSISVNESSSSEFLLQWFFYKEPILLDMVTGTGIGAGKLDLNDLKGLKIKLPTLPEQIKIATFLSTTDEKINLLKEKKALLEEYKKGMMQKIFSQELRFKDDTSTELSIGNGKDFGDWEMKTLGECSTFYSGGTPSTTKREYYEGSIPFIKSGEISSSETKQFISESGLKNSSAKMVSVGDVLYAMYGATSGEVSISKINGAINQAVLCIKSELDHVFLFNYLRFEKENIISTFIQGGQGNLSANIIKELIVPVPQLEEQTKIATFLSAIDEKIELVTQQIEDTQEYKKGLLQGMFC